MASRVPSDSLVAPALAGNSAAMARLMSRAEAGSTECRAAMASLYAKAGQAHVIGITGVPGSGKSTLVATLTLKLRASGKRVGIIAVDPSSPYSGGSIMGDRIRMSELVQDVGVFIRSMATRGAQGGLARASLEAVDVLDAAGFDYVLIETVGVGQAEVEIARAAHTVVVVSAPGLGDDIQAIKAGILEIADIHVVSKCDRSDANRTISDLKTMLTMGLSLSPGHDWQAPVVPISSVNGEGFEPLIECLQRHGRFMRTSEAGQARVRRIAEFRMLKTAEDLLHQRFLATRQGALAAVSSQLAQRLISPYQAAERLLAGINLEGTP
ncbi:methylmalonyl Co-A mutase-associated GTPase MeaB [Rhodoferax sp.]|uniref:methylmalonyl Co-A mutase-associated GTPase MeaB n=1 Tax=Rhodoferax sp. TaxID=50421 RepID=UPI0039B84EC1